MQIKRFFLFTLYSCSFFFCFAQSDLYTMDISQWSFIEHSQLKDEDTSSFDRYNAGTLIFDANLGVKPDARHSINTTVRFMGSFGSFFPVPPIQMRELYAKGQLVNDKLWYQIGDFQESLSPYTLHNFRQELWNKTPSFNANQDFIRYNNFYQANTWRRQGLALNAKLKTNQKKDDLLLSSSLSRSRGVNVVTELEENIALLATGSVAWKKKESFSLKLNMAHHFSLQNSSDNPLTYTNTVGSLQSAYVHDLGGSKLEISLETAASRLAYQTTDVESTLTAKNRKGGVFDVGVNWKNDVFSFGLRYRYVDIYFFSQGAQTKRIAFDSSATVFGTVNSQARGLTIFDLVADNAIYNRQLNHVLMPYDLRYENTTPYGVATPNREGVTFKGDLNLGGGVTFSMKMDLLKEVSLLGFEDKKVFRKIASELTLPLHSLFYWNKKQTLYAMIRNESGLRNEVADTLDSDLKTMFVSVGGEFEILKNVSLLPSYQLLKAKGQDNLFDYGQTNQISDFPTIYQYDQTQKMYSLGVRYSYKDNIFLTVNWQQFQSDDKLIQANNYRISRFNILFSVNI